MAFGRPDPARAGTNLRAGYTQTLSPLLFASAARPVQLITHTVSANARVRWKYSPDSELFIVYNEERDSEAAIGVPGLLNTP